MVFSFSMLRGIGARADLTFLLREFFRPLGSGANELTDAVVQFVMNMRGGLLGSIGLAFLVYTVISTIQKVETSFNAVWRVDRSRSLARRFAEYLSVMIVGPILLAVALGLLGSAKQSPAAQWLNSIPPLAWTLNVFGGLVPYAIVTAVFTFMYSFIPNTRVEPRAALVGGITAGIVWALVGEVFTAVIFYSSQMIAVYSGFAIVLTTLIWVYLSWLILLIGAQLAFYVQFPQYLRHAWGKIELTGNVREQVALSIMYLIGRDYGVGKIHWTARGLAAELDVPGAALAPLLECLESSGLVVAATDERFVPGRDPARIALAEVIESVRSETTGGSTAAVRLIAPAAQVIDELDAAMRHQLGSRSLKDFIGAA
jgi:membrane protein